MISPPSTCNVVALSAVTAILGNVTLLTVESPHVGTVSCLHKGTR